MAKLPSKKMKRSALADGETTMPDAIEVKRQRTFLDLENFEDVTVVKVGSFIPVTTAAEAMERLGNSTEKFLAVVNDGLEQEFGNALVADSTKPWFETDDDGKPTETVFTGVPADKAVVNALILNIAKMNYNYGEKSADGKPMSAEAKAEAKKLAKEDIKNSPPIMNGLKKKLAASNV